MLSCNALKVEQLLQSESDEESHCWSHCRHSLRYELDDSHLSQEKENFLNFLPRNLRLTYAGVGSRFL